MSAFASATRASPHRGGRNTTFRWRRSPPSSNGPAGRSTVTFEIHPATPSFSDEGNHEPQGLDGTGTEQQAPRGQTPSPAATFVTVPRGAGPAWPGRGCDGSPGAASHSAATPTYLSSEPIAG